MLCPTTDLGLVVSRLCERRGPQYVGNVDPTVFQRMILHLVSRTGSFVKVSVEPLPEALGLILKLWETGPGPLITRTGLAALHFKRQRS